MHFILKIAQRKNGGQPLRRSSGSRRRRASGERPGPTDASCFVRVATQSPWTKEVRLVGFPIRTTRVTRSICVTETFWFCTLTGRSKLRIKHENNTRRRGWQRLRVCTRNKVADELVGTIYRSITEFRGTKLLADDITLVVLKTC
jgi:hypothetical protein